MTMVAMSMPPQPPTAKPRFQPEKSPEMTAPTPSAHSEKTPAWRFSVRLSKYSCTGDVVGHTPFMPLVFVGHVLVPCSGGLDLPLDRLPGAEPRITSFWNGQWPPAPHRLPCGSFGHHPLSRSRRRYPFKKKGPVKKFLKKSFQRNSLWKFSD